MWRTQATVRSADDADALELMSLGPPHPVVIRWAIGLLAAIDRRTTHRIPRYCSYLAEQQCRPDYPTSQIEMICPKRDMQIGGVKIAKIGQTNPIEYPQPSVL